MAGNLTEVVQHLSVVSNGGAPARHVHPRYQEALQAHWGQSHKKAADLISSLLADEPDADFRFAGYRLWIEALCETGDKASLAVLRDHLFMRGQAEPDDHHTYAGLRAVVHFELDEFQAAKLLARSMTDLTHDPYCLEAVQLVNGRLGVNEDHPDLCRSTVRLDDYFHWQTLCRGLLKAKEEDALATALEFVREHVRGAPLPHLFEYHRCVDGGLFAGAALVAQRLTELFPQSVDYRYYYAYALFEDGDYPTARKMLQETLRMAGDKDAEVIGLLGHCHAKLGDAEKAAQCLRSAVALLKAEGLPTSHVSLELANVEDELRGDREDPVLTMPREPQNWLIKLSPRRYNELLTSSDSQVDRLLRPMGAKPKPGDYCFFASADQPDVWKIVAVYAVDSEPMWHPTAGYHSALKLVTRLPFGIPVDMQTEDEGAQQSASELAREDPYRYGVYQIDAGALDIIEEAVKMQRDDMIERRRNAQSRRPTA